jgi:hypothetical protein
MDLDFWKVRGGGGLELGWGGEEEGWRDGKSWANGL